METSVGDLGPLVLSGGLILKIPQTRLPRGRPESGKMSVVLPQKRGPAERRSQLAGALHNAANHLRVGMIGSRHHIRAENCDAQGAALQWNAVISTEPSASTAVASL